MGNNNSHQGHMPVEVVRRPPSRPNEPPSARPISSLGPQGPSYHSPENMVLPKELPNNIRLRPVSMELSKYNPEYENMFSYKDIDSYDNENNNEKGVTRFDDMEKPSSPPRPPPPVQNGHIPGATPPQSPQDSTDSKTIANNVKSSNHVPYKPSHRRQMSLTNNLTGHTIMEEPEEEIDNRIKLDPLMQSFPGATGPSLPVKNTSNLDYSYQLTYAQLAEARRNKTLENLEKKTGKRLSDLSADLSEHMEKPTFDRGSPARTSSKSLGSAISSKKKMAPMPPGAAPPKPPAASSLPNSPRSPQVSKSRRPYSVHNEPPADYDMESPRRRPESVVLPRYNSKAPVSNVKPLQRNGSQHQPPVAPPPPVFGANNTTKKAVNLSRNNSLSSGKPELVLRKAPNVKSPRPEENENNGGIPWLLEIKTKSEARAARQQSQESINSTDKPGLVEVKNLTEEETNALNDIDQAISPGLTTDEVDHVNKDDTKTGYTVQEPATKTVERSNSLKEVAKPASPKLQRHFSTTAFDNKSAPVMQRQTSAPAAGTDPMRRLSSLLQHDIKAAANAKCVKLVKQTTPVKPKPKDPHTVFREQLQKACAARDERVKTDGTIDDNLKSSPLETKGKIIDADPNDKDSEKDTSSVSSREPPEVMPKPPPRYHKNVTLNKQASNYASKPRHIRSLTNDQVKESNRVSAQSLDWTPEDDLDSDDNLSDREQLTQKKNDTDGFKSTIVPKNVNDLKTKKGKGKQKKPKDVTSAEDQGKSKIGSVKKFKKSMHKSVRNAFGSISKASGKLLRKQKTEEFEVVEDAPKNWIFSNEPQKMSNGDVDRVRKKNLQRDYHDDTSDTDSEKLMEDIDFSDANFLQNGNAHSDDESPEEEDLNTSQTITRAGVAYINPEGKLVVIPDSEAKSRKVAKQKEKERYSYEASLKKKEKAAAKAVKASEEMARNQEEERRKQLERELELTRMREVETRERLQRLENVHLQQQLNAQLLQQQQQQGMTMLSAPPLPSSGPYPTSIPNTAQTPGFTNLFGQQVPQTTFPTNYGLYPQNGPVLQNNMQFDINDYMRMMGIQNPPTTQQMAYYLNNMTLTGQQFDFGSSPNLFNFVSQDPVKQFPNGTMGTMGYQNMDTSVRKPNFQNWASSPNLNTTTNLNNNTVPLADFVSDYNGAMSNNDKDKKSKGRNPLYNSDESDEGLSPQRTVTIGAVSEYRTLPKRTESGKFMKQFGDDYNSNSRTLPIRSESGKFMKKYGGTSSKGETSDYHIVRVGSSATDLSLNGDVPHTHRQRSVSPSNSSSTIDSAITSAESTLSPPPSPSRSSSGVPPSPQTAAKLTAGSGFKTVLDLTSPNCTAKILMDTGSQDGL